MGSAPVPARESPLRIDLQAILSPSIWAVRQCSHLGSRGGDAAAAPSQPTNAGVAFRSFRSAGRQTSAALKRSPDAASRAPIAHKQIQVSRVIRRPVLFIRADTRGAVASGANGACASGWPAQNCAPGAPCAPSSLRSLIIQTEGCGWQVTGASRRHFPTAYRSRPIDSHNIPCNPICTHRTP
jgi:hypothetical protein